jgi:hypothetical protein
MANPVQLPVRIILTCGLLAAACERQRDWPKAKRRWDAQQGRISDAEPEIEQLIDRLIDISEPDVGYSPTVFGRRFLPVDVEPPFVIGGMHMMDEYDYNPQTTKAEPPGVDLGAFMPDSSAITEYVVKIGDLCFAAIGQIVNRRFDAVRYPPTGIIIVNSPVQCVALREAVRREWGSLGLERHLETLIQDVRQPDCEDRRDGAIKRLAYYDPEAAARVEIEQLSIDPLNKEM